MYILHDVLSILNFILARASMLPASRSFLKCTNTGVNNLPILELNGRIFRMRVNKFVGGLGVFNGN